MNRFGNTEYVVDWGKDGEKIRNYKDQKTGKIRSHNYNLNYIFKEGITFTAISSSQFSCRYMKESLFGSGGSGICKIDKEYIFFLLGVLNSKVAKYLLGVFSLTMNYEVNNVGKLPLNDDRKAEANRLVEQNIFISKNDWDSFETSWDFKYHPFLTVLPLTSEEEYSCSERMAKLKNARIKDRYSLWENITETNFNLLKANEEELDRIFIEIYGLQDELTPEVEDKDVTIRKAELRRDIRSLISYAAGCMFGRYSLDVEGLAYAGGEWDNTKYKTFIPDADNILPITDEEYFKDDIVGLFVAFVKKSFGEETLEENLRFIADALGTAGNTSREIIRNYFIKDFFKDHVKIYQKRPIYWLFDSGKENGFKALIYMHRYDENTIGNLRIDYLHRMQRIYDNEINRMSDIMLNSKDAREKTNAEKRKAKLTKQLKETKDYDEKIAHLAVARIAIDLDDGVKVNYEKLQTDTDGKKLEVLGKV